MISTLISIVLLLQTVATPIADGQLIVSSEAPQFPDLPEGIEPTRIDENWELLYYDVVTTPSHYIIRGEIRNASPNPLDTPVIVLTLSEGTRIGTPADIAYAAPGARVPFSESVGGDAATIALNQSQEVTVFTCDNYGVVPKQETSWEFSDVEIEWEAERSAVQVSGTVTNLGPTAERYVPMLFGFTETGHYLGSIDALESPGTLFTGETTDFEMDQRFNTYHTDEPFVGAGRVPIFVLAMATTVGIYMNCA